MNNQTIYRPSFPKTGWLIVIIPIIVVAVVLFFSTCQLVTVDGDEEGVFTKQPWFFGHGGVDAEPLTQGSAWKVFTTKFTKFKTVPIRYDETFDDDAFSDDNTPLDITAYMTIMVKKGQTPELLQNFGEDWLDNNLRVKFRTLVRGEVCKYSMYDLVSNRDCLIQINDSVYNTMNAYIQKIAIPVTLVSIDVNRVRPNEGVLQEMNNTAVQIQARQTQIRAREMEEVRAKTEAQRAIADKAYRNEMGMTTEQFLQLRWIEVAEKNGSSIDVLLGGNASPLWNVKR